MDSQAINYFYTFNVTGNIAAAITEINNSITVLDNKMKDSKSPFESLGKAFNQILQNAQAVSQIISTTMAPGAALDASLTNISGRFGVVGEGLETIEQYARETAKTFGGSASQAANTYYALLSELNPELAKTPEALKAMGHNVAVLSKSMGGDTIAATETLTTAMKQYGVSLDNPMKASREMAEMMNIMAAGSRQGSATLPEVKAALEQCGSAAKNAGVSFAETNAAIQLLDKAGKEGAEGGVALQKVMTTLSNAQFIPKEAADELAAAGVDINALTDQSKTLAQRLEPLKAIMGDSALLAKIFGEENSIAAMALVESSNQMSSYTEAITGTNTAFEQAGTVMDSYNEKKARVQAQMDDFKLSIFNATGTISIWAETITGAIGPIVQFGSFVVNTCKLVSSFMVVTCKIISGAITSIPLIGWIAGAIAAIIALGVYFWNTSAEFRAVLKGLSAAFVAVFGGIWTLAKQVFGSIGDLIKAAFSLDPNGIKKAIDSMKEGFSDFGSSVSNAFNSAYETEIANSNAEQEAKNKKKKETETPYEQWKEENTTQAPKPKAGGGAISKGFSNIGGNVDKTDVRKSMNISIDKLIGKFEIHTTNLREDVSKVKDLVAEALVTAVNDVNHVS